MLIRVQAKGFVRLAKPIVSEIHAQFKLNQPRILTSKNTGRFLCFTCKNKNFFFLIYFYLAIKTQKNIDKEVKLILYFLINKMFKLLKLLNFKMINFS